MEMISTDARQALINRMDLKRVFESKPGGGGLKEAEKFIKQHGLSAGSQQGLCPRAILLPRAGDQIIPKWRNIHPDCYTLADGYMVAECVAGRDATWSIWLKPRIAKRVLQLEVDPPLVIGAEYDIGRGRLGLLTFVSIEKCIFETFTDGRLIKVHTARPLDYVKPTERRDGVLTLGRLQSKVKELTGAHRGSDSISRIQLLALSRELLQMAGVTQPQVVSEARHG